MDFPSDAVSLQGLLEMALHTPLALDAEVAEIASWAAATDTETAPSSSVTRDAASDSASDSSGGGGDGDARRRKRPKANAKELKHASDDEPKPRKPTYLVRKEEKGSLNDEIRLLEARLELLKVRAGLPTGEQQRTLSSVQSANFEIEEAIHANLLGIARFHSLLARHLHSIPVTPMNTHIHLSKDIAERRATLRAMREMKLRRAMELTENRMRYVDATKPYSTEERYISDDGTYHCKRFEILPFEGVRDVKQVFDALMFYHSNVEIAVTESLGQLTLREDMDSVDPSIWNHRLSTAMGPDSNYVLEQNTVGFTQFFEASEHHHGQQYGIIAMDAVDVDDLYPYKPHERVRRDITAAMSVSEVRKPGSPHKIVAIRRCTFLALHQPQFPLPRAVRDEMRLRIAEWCSVMAKFMQDALSPMPTA